MLGQLQTSDGSWVKLQQQGQGVDINEGRRQSQESKESEDEGKMRGKKSRSLRGLTM